MWDLASSRGVLYGSAIAGNDPASRLIARVQAIEQSAKNCSAVFSIQGSYLQNIDIFLDNDLFQTIGYSHQETNPYVLLFSSPQNDSDSLFERIRKYLHLKLQSILAYRTYALTLRVRDYLGRSATFKVADLVYSQWASNAIPVPTLPAGRLPSAFEWVTRQAALEHNAQLPADSMLLDWNPQEY